MVDYHSIFHKRYAMCSRRQTWVCKCFYCFIDSFIYLFIFYKKTTLVYVLYRSNCVDLNAIFSVTKSLRYPIGCMVICHCCFLLKIATYFCRAQCYIIIMIRIHTYLYIVHDDIVSAGKCIGRYDSQSLCNPPMHLSPFSLNIS